jgi:hypothetical protein
VADLNQMLNGSHSWPRTLSIHRVLAIHGQQRYVLSALVSIEIEDGATL